LIVKNTWRGLSMSRGLKVGLIVGGIVLAILLILPLTWGGFSGWRGGWGMMGPGWGMMGPGMMGGYGWGWLPLLMIVFWGLVIWGIVAAVRSASNRKGSDTSTTALEVLKRRYALGEIKKKEYEEKKRDLL
jgi:putative membrane protein